MMKYHRLRQDLKFAVKMGKEEDFIGKKAHGRAW